MQTGHEAMVAHNSAILEEGYIYGSEYLALLNPDLIMGGHSFVMNHPAAFIERYRRWSHQMRDAFRDLSSEKDYRYWFDPFWVRAQPYRVNVRRGESVEIELHVRNFNSRLQTHSIEVHSVGGLIPEVPRLTGKVSGNSRAVFPLRLRAATDAETGVPVSYTHLTLPTSDLV